ncbi:hypothetical protein PCANC_21854 [Puccinia coronata f. sp. avenae]|uniref:Uncharacterized protein n=1 Tax=Puccinia coronata f. sp. avenae TaxID=200324 RepID=A0A2N5SDQ4_9BASI|nr:hypothetical protein PCANC_21854 [Puccinia coronata f. sp. avenae]PLW32698.1 hypothetical protein PCASD_16830 [Puccinia coronata f. sp. avenae]
MDFKAYDLAFSHRKSLLQAFALPYKSRLWTFELPKRGDIIYISQEIISVGYEEKCALPYKDSIMVEGEAERFQQTKPHTFDKPHLL